MKKTDINIQNQIIATNVLGMNKFPINKRLLSMYGPELAVYITNLTDEYINARNRGELDSDDSFILTHLDQQTQTGMSVYQLRKCKNQLKEMGVLTTKRRGAPPKEWYILDLEKLADLVFYS